MARITLRLCGPCSISTAKPPRHGLCSFYYMAISQQLKQYAGRRVTRRIYRSMPWIGGAIALATVVGAIRRKGFLGGTLDTALDFIPFVGAAKNVAETVRGRDFIPERSQARAPLP